MKIGIEAQRIFRPHKHGMDRVALELVRNLQQIDTNNQYYIFVKPDQDNGVLQESENLKIVEVTGGAYPFWEQLELPKAVKKYGCDLLHCTSNTAPLYGHVPLLTTVHDVIYLEKSFSKQLFSKASSYQKFGNAYRRMIVPRILKSSKRLITVSEFEKTNIVKRIGNGIENKLSAVHNGVSSHFKIVEDDNHLSNVKQKYNLPEQYILFFGSKDPRKNTKRVLSAVSKFSEKFPSYGMVLMNYSELELNALLSELQIQNLTGKIVLPGYVDDLDLPAIYQAAKVFLFPSLREGFGIPVIEAMACGTPVITSNTSSMPEVAGDAAHLVDPFSVDAIVEGMEKVLQEGAYRQELVRKGLIQKDKFSWSSMAERVLKIYNEIYEEHNV